MKNIKKFIILIICMLFLLNTAVYAYSPSDWAFESVNKAYSLGIAPASDLYAYTSDITRLEFCSFAVSFYNKITSSETPEHTVSYFSDTNDSSVLYAADLGIITGRGDEVFSPDDAITRQEMAAVICRLLNVCNIDVSVSGADVITALSSFSDSESINGWAVNSIAFCLKNSIIKGMSDTELMPYYHTTREQAIVILLRCYEKFASDENEQDSAVENSSNNPYDNLNAYVYGDLKLNSYYDRTLDVSFSPMEGADKYKIDIWLDESNFWYSDEDVYVKTLYSDTTSFILDNIRVGKKYKINIFGTDSDKMISALAYVESLYTLAEKEKQISAENITSKETADSLMETITVNVWKLNQNGEKYASSASLSVHKNIAEITKMAFEEIFENNECFPIKDVGAYAWRDEMSSGRYSHHNYGTAIDINYNENYCLYKDGSYIGNCYLPTENPYSFPPDGSVISIFSKYGFAWGGDEWSNPKDYMHFSYLEL